MARLWLIGGTSESAQLAAAIATSQLPCTVTVTSQSAQALYPETPLLRVVVRILDPLGMENFCVDEQIKAILDASHPHAAEVSQQAIAIAKKRQIPYLRYERPTVDSLLDSRPITQLDGFEPLLTADYLEGQRVLLTVGYKPLHLFQPWQGRSVLFTRILPSPTALEGAIAAGFTGDRIIALRPPISFALEKALWLNWRISLVVTKASGIPGGENVKRAVADALGIPLAIIARPAIGYPQQTSDILEAIAFCRQHLNLN